MKNTILYLKVITIFWLVFSIYGVISRNFDPTDFLKSEFAKTVFGQNTLPETAEKGFQFPFMLFALLSIVTSTLMYYIIHYALSKKERWAADALLLGALVWVGGATLIVLTYKYDFYFLSIGIFTVTVVLPFIWVRRYLK